jgi:hypothetical protein
LFKIILNRIINLISIFAEACFLLIRASALFFVSGGGFFVGMLGDAEFCWNWADSWGWACLMVAAFGNLAKNVGLSLKSFAYRIRGNR